MFATQEQHCKNESHAKDAQDRLFCDKSVLNHLMLMGKGQATYSNTSANPDGSLADPLTSTLVTMIGDKFWQQNMCSKGEVVTFVNGNMQLDFTEEHYLHDIVRYFERGPYKCKEFLRKHPRLCGHIFVIEDGVHVRTEFAAGHNKHGIVHHIKCGKIVHVERVF